MVVHGCYWVVLHNNPKNTVGVILCVSHTPWGRLSSPDPGPASTESNIKAQRPRAGTSASWWVRSAPEDSLVSLLGGLLHAEPVFEVPNMNFQISKKVRNQTHPMFNYIGSVYEFMGVHFRWRKNINPNPIKGIVPGTGEVTMPTLRTPMPNKQHCSFRHRGGYYPDAGMHPCPHVQNSFYMCIYIICI